MFGKPKKFWLSLALPLAVGGLAALLSGGMGDFKNMQQPPLSPPGWGFPIVPADGLQCLSDLQQ